MPTTAATPSYTGPDGKQLTWVDATPHSTGKPTEIRVAVATTNYPEDQVAPQEYTHPLPFSLPFPPQFQPLLQAAEDTWELYANIKFINVPDAPSIGQSADIRVGVASVSEPTKDYAGYTTGPYNTINDKLKPDQLVRIEDPAVLPVTRLPNSDYQYNGSDTTVFQDLLHELGHALGLDHNPNDPTSVMSPVLASNNRLPDAQDIAGIQAIYGAPKPHSVILSQSETNTINNLTRWHLA